MTPEDPHTSDLVICSEQEFPMTLNLDLLLDLMIVDKVRDDDLLPLRLVILNVFCERAQVLEDIRLRQDRDADSVGILSKFFPERDLRQDPDVILDVKVLSLLPATVAKFFGVDYCEYEDVPGITKFPEGPDIIRSFGD
ncbi:unnamed protein product [Allacma fusca]|uniref:Uncharacterized protein n=1 Tax=Allacma fusca TaxID=39272 RepID=A0A8J2K099_9HEXA|nr:unnamed protein product [Allacma fusca]